MDNNTFKQTLKIFNELSRIYTYSELESLTKFNYISHKKDINELEEEKERLENIIDSQDSTISELENELIDIKQNLYLLPNPENLYDLQKIEIIVELYNKCNLKELENLKNL